MDDRWICSELTLLGTLNLATLVDTQPRGHPASQLVVRHFLAVLEDYCQTDVLTIHFVGNGKANGFSNGRVLCYNVAKLNWVDLLTTIIDELVDSPDDDNLTILVLLGVMAGSEKAFFRKRRAYWPPGC